MDGVKAKHANIDADVEFKSVKQQGTIDVSLHNIVFAPEVHHWHVMQFLKEHDIVSFCSVLRFCDKCCLWELLFVVSEPLVVLVIAQVKGCRNEVKFVRGVLEGELHCLIEGFLVIESFGVWVPADCFPCL